MTTIVYKDGILATDSRLSADGHLISDSNIKGIQTTKYLAAASGDAAMCDLFLEWAKTDFDVKHKPDIPHNVSADDFTGMAFNEDGEMTLYSASLLPIIVGHVEIYSSGSGGDFAHGACLMGATAEQAVEIAKQIDMNSGGPVQVFTFKKVPKRKK